MAVSFATWNVNSIKMRTEHVQRFLNAQAPDILAMQEIKCTDDKFPHAEFRDTHPHQIVKGQPAYNGVAIISKIPFDVISTSLPRFDHGDNEQARYIEIAIHDDKPFHLVNVYVPNGNPVEDAKQKFRYKLEWLEALFQRAEDLFNARIPFAITGDFNIIPENQDCFDPQLWLGDALFRPETWQAWRKLRYLGLTDAYRALHPDEPQAYTFWDYQAGCWPRNNGIRIDHALLSPGLADRLLECRIDRTPRGEEKPSDHTPLIVTLS